MEEKRKREWLRLALAAACGVVLGWLLHLLSGATEPGMPASFGQWLRELSLSGAGGNAAAWVIVAVISLLPALGLLWKGRQKADWLLLLAGLELLAGLYFLVNPTLLYPYTTGLAESLMVQGWALVAGGCVLGTLAAWALLRLLKRLEMTPARLLPAILNWGAALYVLLAVGVTVHSLLSDLSAVKAGNTDPGRVLTSGLLLAVIALLGLIPELMGAWVLLWGGNLARALDEAPFEEGTVALAETIARRCGRVARISLLISVAGNLLQLVCVPAAASVHVTVNLPLLTLALCAALLLLCKYFRRAKAVSDDNATII